MCRHEVTIDTKYWTDQVFRFLKSLGKTGMELLPMEDHMQRCKILKERLTTSQTHASVKFHLNAILADTARYLEFISELQYFEEMLDFDIKKGNRFDVKISQRQKTL